MTKSTLLLWLDEVASKLGEMRVALEQLPEAEENLGDRVTEQKNKEVVADRLCIVRLWTKKNFDRS